MRSKALPTSNEGNHLSLIVTEDDNPKGPGPKRAPSKALTLEEREEWAIALMGDYPIEASLYGVPVIRRCA